MFEAEWDAYIVSNRTALKLEKDVRSPLIYYNLKNVIGSVDDFVPWVYQNYDFHKRFSNDELNQQVQVQFEDYFHNRNHVFCYMDIEIGPDTESECKAGNSKVERVVMELFNDIVPRTCENFRRLCDDGYQESPFHRVVTGGWVQGGDIKTGRGDHSESAVSGVFPDENYGVKHSGAGILSMANDGKPHTNGSQFFVTLNALPWLDKKRVAFGRIQYGMKTFRSIERLPQRNERPQGVCKIIASGVFTPETGISAQMFSDEPIEI